MRNILLGTTAIVAAGIVASHAQAADPISLQLGGYYRVAYYGIMSESDDGAQGLNSINGADGVTGGSINTGTGVPALTTSSEAGFNRHPSAFVTDGEIHFNGSTTLDNGIGVSVRIELEVLDDSGGNDGGGAAFGEDDIMDEHYIRLSGGFGRVQIGVDDTIGNSYSTTAPVGASLFGVNSPTFITSNIGGTAVASNSTVITLGSDAASIRYETPTFAGFRMGVSYAPDSGDGDADEESDLGQGGTLNAADGRGATYGIAASYGSTIGDIGINWSGAAAYAVSDATNGSDSYQWQSGLNVSFFGFTVGGSYRHAENLGTDQGRSDVYDVGVSYNTGPVTVGLSMSQGTYNVSAARLERGVATGETVGGAGAGTMTMVQLGATYALGPGVSLQGALTWNEFDSRQAFVSQNINDARGIENNDYQSWSGGLALGLSF